MVSISEVVKSIVKTSPLLEDGLARGIISYSSLARYLRPQIEKRLIKTVSRGSIVMALKRASKDIKSKQKKIQNRINLDKLTVSSGLVELTYSNSDTIAEKPKEVFAICEKKKGVFCSISQGVRETMIVTEEEIEDDVRNLFKHEHLIARVGDISAITILLNKGSVFTPGVYYTVLKIFAWSNINIIDIVSTYSELTVIFANKDIDRAFSVIRNYVSI